MNRRIVKTATTPPPEHHIWAEYKKPFTSVPTAVLDTDKLDRAQKLVLISILRRLDNRKAPAAVSVRSIARDWDMRPRTVQLVMEWAEIAGWLVRSDTKTKEGTVKYILNLVQLARWLSEQGVLPVGSRVLPGGSRVLPVGTGVLPGGSTPTPSQSLKEDPPKPPAQGREGFASGTGTGGTTVQDLYGDRFLQPDKEGYLTPSERREITQRELAGTPGLRFPRKVGKKYRNKVAGFCNDLMCDEGEIPPGKAWLLNFPAGARLYCDNHVEAGQRFLLAERAQHL